MNDLSLLSSPLFALAALPALAACSGSAVDSAAPPEPATVEIAAPIRLAPRARVPEREPGFLDAEVGEGVIVITHGPEMPAFSAGQVISGTQGGGYLARVIAAREVDPARVELSTAPADLTELIAEGHVRVHTGAAPVGATEWQQGDERVGSHADALRVAGGAPLSIFEIAGVDVGAACGVRAEGKVEIDAAIDLAPSLDFELEIGARDEFDPTPEIQRLRLVVGGTLDLRAKLRADGRASAACTIDLLDLAGGAAAIPLPSLTVWAGPVPIVISNQLVPRAKVDIGLSFTAAEVEAEARTTASIEAGVEANEGVWSTVWTPAGSSSGAASLRAPGAIEARATLRGGAEIQSRLYGVVGPDIGVTAEVRAALGSEAPYCRYEMTVDGGVRAYAAVEAGVDAGPLHLSLGKLDVVSMDIARFPGLRTSGALRDDAACAPQPSTL